MNAFDLDFPAHIWAPFAQGRPPIRCSPGYLIYLQGTEATCFYYLKEGQVRSFIQSEDGAERALNVYGPGSLFGEASFLTSCREYPLLWPSQAVRSWRLTGSWSPRRLKRTQNWPWL